MLGSLSDVTMQRWASSLACDAFSSVYSPNSLIITFVAFSLRNRDFKLVVFYFRETTFDLVDLRLLARNACVVKGAEERLLFRRRNLPLCEPGSNLNNHICCKLLLI